MTQKQTDAPRIPALRKHGFSLHYACPVPDCTFSVQGPVKAEQGVLAEIRLHNKTLAANEERTCRDCGRGFPRPEGRGRPPVRCEACRQERADGRV